ncbi:MAG: CRISPR-associated endonuclease Cas1 [Planctomycetes bacterium]|nr:CRISPR-associated endonuclease Cas1 [Planctomycetota bacterium]
MPTLYVTQPGATVRTSGGTLLVTAEIDPDGKEGPKPLKRQTLLEVEPHRVEAIVLVGHSHITSDALHLCLEKDIPVALLSSRGKCLGRLTPPGDHTVQLRIRQYQAAADPQTAFHRGRNVVSAKVANAAEVLRTIQSNDAANPNLSPAIAELKRIRGDVQSCESVERLLGLEGAAAHEYFSAYGPSFRTEITFTTRQRRPPPDPANALLSFGYVILGNLIQGALDARGFESAIGFFHQVQPGRASLALDLLEELRHPVVDRFVLRGCNLRIFQPDMFEPDAENPGGVRLTRDGLKTFFSEWEKHLLRPLRCASSNEDLAVLPLVRRQVDGLAADLQGNKPYVPFLYGD